MNDYERKVAGHLHQLENLLQQSHLWDPTDLQSHNHWANERQPQFEHHLQEARDGLDTTTTIHKEPQSKPPLAWTPEAVTPYTYRSETGYGKVGVHFARQVAERLRQIEQEWDARMEELYRRSRR
jgi:hypothetical protein